MYDGLPAIPSMREISESATSAMPKSMMRTSESCVDDAAGVRVVQRLRALEHDLDDVIDAQQVVGAAIRRERARAVHVFGDDVAAAVFLTRVVDRQDVRMLQHADHVRFREEHLAGDLGPLVGRILVHVVDLDRDIPPVIRIVREIDGAGGAAADLVDDYIFADAIRNAVFQDLCGLRVGTGLCGLQRHL
jgi:hypothetical protein